MAKAVTIIPATKDKFTALPTSSIQKRRVAAYARVSTDSDEQFTSYEAQIDYYTQYIKKRDDWEFVKVYTDEGITGTSTKHREGFNEMVADALAGKIDLIVTKSVSRFARNTVDSLVTVRKLKEHHVEIYFEKENIFTFDSKGELLITIMSSLAQEESRSISENVTWGQRKRFADGKVTMPYKQFLGYERGEDGVPVINEKEAEVVRLIYKLFLQGKTATGICKQLELMSIPTPAGKTKWNQSTVMSILQNEKYKGDALLQKNFTIDFLTKKQKKNEGEVPQYYVEGSHPAIISEIDFDMAQAEIARRQALGRSYSGSSVFASKLICGDCGGFYGQKVWHSNSCFKKYIWRCNNKFSGEHKCETPAMITEDIQTLFLQAFNQLMETRDELIASCEEMRMVVADCTALDDEITGLQEEISVVSELVSQSIKDNASTKQSQEAFQKRYQRLKHRYETAQKRLKECNSKKEDKIRRDCELRIFIEELKKAPLVTEEWDSELWNCLLDKAIIFRDNHITFRFRNGTEITITIQNGVV